MTTEPTSDAEKIEAAASSYPRFYEIMFMNSDTPRLSGVEYLIHGFKAGVAYRDSNPSPKVLAVVEALEKIELLGSSEKAYTSDFTTETMGIARKALKIFKDAK